LLADNPTVNDPSYTVHLQYGISSNGWRKSTMESVVNSGCYNINVLVANEKQLLIFAVVFVLFVY
jgi:hypothetical protein